VIALSRRSRENKSYVTVTRSPNGTYYLLPHGMLRGAFGIDSSTINQKTKVRNLQKILVRNLRTNNKQKYDRIDGTADCNPPLPEYSRTVKVWYRDLSIALMIRPSTKRSARAFTLTSRIACSSSRSGLMPPALSLGSGLTSR
jgi:hypothetical protein